VRALPRSGELRFALLFVPPRYPLTAVLVLFVPNVVSDLFPFGLTPPTALFPIQFGHLCCCGRRLRLSPYTTGHADADFLNRRWIPVSGYAHSTVPDLTFTLPDETRFYRLPIHLIVLLTDIDCLFPILRLTCSTIVCLVYPAHFFRPHF